MFQNCEKMETFSPKLDTLSENIVYLLSIDSRLSVSEIAKKLGVRRKLVEHRVKRLYKERFISPLLIYNYKGLIKATILVKLSKFDAEAINSLIKFPHVVKLKETLGKYDFSLFVITNTRTELNKILKKLEMLFSVHLLNIDVVFHKFEDSLGYKAFCHQYELMQYYKSLRYDPHLVLASEQLAVIQAFRVEPHLSYRGLIQRTGVPYKRVKAMVDGLVDSGVIRISIAPNNEKLGLEFHNVLAKVNLSKHDEFQKNIMKIPNIHWMKKGQGRWDFLLSISSRNIQEFIDITRQIRTENKELLYSFEALISKTHVRRWV